MSLNGKANGENTLRAKLDVYNTINGKSAYELAVINGFRGTEKEWLDSLEGVDGKDGNDYILTDKDKHDIANNFSKDYMEEWLNEHPEATTTVQDGSLTPAKFKGCLTPQMFYEDGDIDDSDAIQRMFNAATDGTKIVFPRGTYKVHPFASLGYRIGDIEGSPSKPAWSKSKYAYGVMLDFKENIVIEFEEGATIESALTYKDSNGVVQFKEHIIGDDFNNIDEILDTFYLHTGAECNGDLVVSTLFKINQCHNIKIIGGEFRGDIPIVELDATTGHPKDINEYLHRNTTGVGINDCSEIVIDGTHSYRFRGGTLHIGGGSVNVIVKNSEFSQSYYHAIVNEGASDVRYINVKAMWADTGLAGKRYSRSKRSDGGGWQPWAEVERTGGFGTSIDIEGISDGVRDKNILVDGCEFGYAETNALNIIKAENVIVRNSIIKDKPLCVQESCFDISITNNKLIGSQFFISKDNVSSINFDGNYVKNGNIRYVSSERSGKQADNIYIRNNHIVQEDDVKGAYTRKYACISLALKTNSSVDVSGNTVVINDGSYKFIDISSTNDNSRASVSHNHFIGGSNIKPLKDMYYILFEINRANVDFTHNKIEVYGGTELTLNFDSITISRLWAMYLTGSNGSTNGRVKIAYNDFKLLTPSIQQAQYIFTSGTSSVERDDFCEFYNNTMYSTGLATANAFKLYPTYGFKVFNNILDNYINTTSALYEKADKLVAINNIVNGVLQ